MGRHWRSCDAWHQSCQSAPWSQWCGSLHRWGSQTSCTCRWWDRWVLGSWGISEWSSSLLECVILDHLLFASLLNSVHIISCRWLDDQMKYPHNGASQFVHCALYQTFTHLIYQSLWLPSASIAGQWNSSVLQKSQLLTDRHSSLSYGSQIPVIEKKNIL